MQAPRFTPEYKSALLCFTCRYRTILTTLHLLITSLPHWSKTAMHASVFTPRAQHHPPYSCSGTQCPAVDVGTASSLQTICWHYRGAMLLAHLLKHARAPHTIPCNSLLCCAQPTPWAENFQHGLSSGTSVFLPLILWWLAHHLVLMQASLYHDSVPPGSNFISIAQ